MEADDSIEKPLTERVRQPSRLDARPFVELLTPENPSLSEFLTERERMWGIDAFVNIRGLEAAGKTKLWRTLVERNPGRLQFAPEVMTRPPRPALANLQEEVDGVDLIYMSERSFRQAVKKGLFLFAYEVSTPEYDEQNRMVVWKSKKAGLLKQTIKRAVGFSGRTLMVLPPPIDFYLLEYFPQMQCVFVNPTAEDYALYRQLRGLQGDRALTDNREKAWARYVVPGTLQFMNPRWNYRRIVRELERRLLHLRTRDKLHDLLPLMRALAREKGQEFEEASLYDGSRPEDIDAVCM